MKKNNLIILVCAILVIALIIYFGLSKLSNKSDSEEFVIGSIQALTGETSKPGLETKEGIDLAVEEINNKGGINGKTLRIIYEDDKCNLKNSVNAAKKLIEIDKIKIVLGPTCSSSAMAVAPIAEENKVVMFVSTASVPALKEAGDYIFRNSLAGELHSIKMADFAFKELNAKTASILYINLDNGIGYKDAFKQRFEELGGKILNSESYEKGISDFKTQLLKIKENNPDVLYIAGQAFENSVKQAGELGMKTQLLGPITIETGDLLNIAPKEAEGLYYSSPSFGMGNDPIEINFQEKYKSKYGKLAEVFAANGYDAAMLIGDALKKCGYKTDCIRDYLYSVKDYHGVSGMTTFDSFGEVSKPLVIKVVKDGKFAFHPE